MMLSTDQRIALIEKTLPPCFVPTAAQVEAAEKAEQALLFRLYSTIKVTASTTTIAAASDRSLFATELGVAGQGYSGVLTKRETNLQKGSELPFPCVLHAIGARLLSKQTTFADLTVFLKNVIIELYKGQQSQLNLGNLEDFIVPDRMGGFAASSTVYASVQPGRCYPRILTAPLFLDLGKHNIQANNPVAITTATSSEVFELQLELVLQPFAEKLATVANFRQLQAC